MSVFVNQINYFTFPSGEILLFKIESTINSVLITNWSISHYIICGRHWPKHLNVLFCFFSIFYLLNMSTPWHLDICTCSLFGRWGNSLTVINFWIFRLFRILPVSSQVDHAKVRMSFLEYSKSCGLGTERRVAFISTTVLLQVKLSEDRIFNNEVNNNF